MKNFILFLALNVLSPSAWALKVIIFTDQEGGTQAKESLKLFKTYPLDRFEIEYQVVVESADKLGCRVTDKPVKGAVACDPNYISGRTQALGGDQAMVVSTVGSRGISGNIPVIPISRPTGSMLHEFMHTFGFADEYCYKPAAVADIYCKETYSRINNVAIPPKNPYASDASARTLHSAKIPWYSRIPAATPIVDDQNLGTPSGFFSDFKDSIGLFESETCTEATKPLVMWKPGRATNVMGDSDETIGPDLGGILYDILKKRGVPLVPTRYQMESSFFGLFESCYQVDSETRGRKLRLRSAKSNCEVAKPDPADVPLNVHDGPRGRIDEHPPVPDAENVVPSSINR